MGALAIYCIFAAMNNVAVMRRKDMNEIKLWLGRHPNVVIALIAGLTIALVAAMYFSYDLSWIPGLLRGLAN
jgi:glucan phosphoethanolaminetransferase (alkaline phosphatase superfamily)